MSRFSGNKASDINLSPDSPSGAAFGATDLLLFLMTAVWGSNFTVIKYAFQDLAPLAFNGVRFLIASATILAVTLASGRGLRVQRGDLRRFFGLGLLANTMYQSFFIIGAARTRAGNAALIVATTPLLTAVIGRLRRDEFFVGKGVAGLFLALVGIGLIVWGGRGESTRGASLLGDALILAATVCWAVYTVASKRFLHTYGSMKTTTLTMVLGTPMLLVVCAPALVRQDWSNVRVGAWAGLMFSALFSIVLAYIIWNHGVQRIGSTRTAIYSNLTPVIAMLVAWPALGEVPTAGQIAGAAVIFISIYLVRHGTVAAIPEEVIEKQLEEASLGPGRN